MDAARTEKLKALALAASPGPWEWWTSNSTLRLTGADGKDGGVLYGYVHSGVGDVSCSDANRAFIAASNPATVLELIAEVERLRAENEALLKGCKLSANWINALEAGYSSPAAGTEKDAVQRVEKRIHAIWEDSSMEWGNAFGGPPVYEIFACRLISAMQGEIDAAHTKAREGA